MAALSFVTEHTQEMVQGDETRKAILDDAHIVESSLNYINDLLRSMLDINLARSGLIQINHAPTDVLHDIIEPAAAILCVRGTRVEVLTECYPKDLAVSTDQLRLKQIILNLAINASKFAERGFIRIRAACENNTVKLYVEDSGPGVPEERREGLFESFQDSMDLLQQGTGIGLSICHNLTHLLGGSIYLDPSYDSGMEGCPGSRFVVDLRQTPMTFGSIISLEEGSFPESSLAEADTQELRLLEYSTPWSTSNTESQGHVEKPKSIRTEALTLTEESTNATAPATSLSHTNSSETMEENPQLPSHLQVLFVDDETILRKLFLRLVQKAAPTWHVTEANSGERVLQLVQEKHYDIIFMDQYMPCTDRTLLGTEIIRKLRTLGVSSMICGLSKNFIPQEFMDAGADHFLRKPVPCQKEAFYSLLIGLCDNRTFGLSEELKQEEIRTIRASRSINNLATEAVKPDDYDHGEDKGPELPESMNVLLVDDETILRKLFIRSVRRVAPSWKITEACNGERALELVRANSQYDLIFMDQYMPSIEQPLLGTDVVKEIRQILSTANTTQQTLICGLSANEMQMEFYASGADWFLLKPFPCDKAAFRNELARFCNIRKLHHNNGETAPVINLVKSPG
eukprot:scaffold134_cov94-Amphora_coffeaeformis.AAC.14